MISLEVKDSIYGKKCRAVKFSRLGRGIKITSCSSVNEQGMRRLLSSNTCLISLPSPSLVTERFTIPSHTSEKSKTVLFKSKLARLDKEKDKDSNSKYSVIYFEDTEKSTNLKASYTVYGVSDTLFGVNLDFNERTRENISFYSVDLFGIVGVSRKVDPENYVLQIFADEQVLHVVLSKGERLEYFRTVDVPDMEGERGLLNDFYYENINITYLYIRQNFSNVKLTVILTGKLHGDERLSAQVTEFVGLQVTPLDVKQIARGVSENDFHEYLVPIGIALLDKRYDFSSQKDQSERLVRKLFLFGNVLFVPAVVVMAFIFMQSYTLFTEKSELMQVRARNLFNVETKLLAEIGDQDILRYKSTFVDIIRGKNSTSVALMKPLEDILEFQKFSNISFEGSGATARASLSLDEPQVYYTSIEDLSRKMIEKLDQVRSRSVDVNDNSIHTLKDLTNKIKIIMTPTKGAR